MSASSANFGRAEDWLKAPSPLQAHSTAFQFALSAKNATRPIQDLWYDFIFHLFRLAPPSSMTAGFEIFATESWVTTILPDIKLGVTVYNIVFIALN